MGNEITRFQYEGTTIRTLTVDGEPWFVATDLAQILGYRDAHNLARRLDDDEKGTHSASTPGGTQEILIISESGLYSAILGSKVQAAKPFKRWITHEVVPQIRRTGGYQSAPELSGPELMAKALLEAQATLEARAEQIAALEQKAEYVDCFVVADDLRTVRNVAKSLGIRESILRQALLDHGWIYVEKRTYGPNEDGIYRLRRRYSAYADKTNYFVPIPAHEAPKFGDEVDHTLKVTPVGAAAIARAARRWGLIGGGQIVPTPGIEGAAS
jgi:anti-repressor protein